MGCKWVAGGAPRGAAAAKGSQERCARARVWGVQQQNDLGGCKGAMKQGLGCKGLGSCGVQWGKVWSAIGNRFRGLRGATEQGLGCNKWRVWGAAECNGSEFECNRGRAWGGCGV